MQDKLHIRKASSFHVQLECALLTHFFGQTVINIKHSKGLSFSCTALMWLFKLLLDLSLEVQSWQLKDLMSGSTVCGSLKAGLLLILLLEQMFSNFKPWGRNELQWTKFKIDFFFNLRKCYSPNIINTMTDNLLMLVQLELVKKIV